MAKTTNPFRYFDSSPEVIRTVVMMYAKVPLSLRIVEYLLAEPGIDICYETVRLWWNRSVKCSPPRTAGHFTTETSLDTHYPGTVSPFAHHWL